MSTWGIEDFRMGDSECSPYLDIILNTIVLQASMVGENDYLHIILRKKLRQI